MIETGVCFGETHALEIKRKRKREREVEGECMCEIERRKTDAAQRPQCLDRKGRMGSKKGSRKSFV